MRRNVICSLISLLLVYMAQGHAQQLPANVDPSRIPGPANNQEVQPSRPDSSNIESDDSVLEGLKIPEQVKNIRLVLKDVQIQGSTAIPEHELKALYQEYLGKEVALSRVWVIALKLTELYREKGYFLSKAFVPEQEIVGGVVKIQIAEGYLGEIIMDEMFTNKDMIVDYMKGLLKIKPIKFQQIEEFLLRLNELSGFRFRSFIEPIQTEAFGMVKARLVVQHTEDTASRSVFLDKNGTDSIGPFRTGFSYRGSVVDFQRTEVTALTSSQNGKLIYGDISQRFPINLALDAQISARYTSVRPGGPLESSEIRSTSTAVDAGLIWKPIRQREKSLTLSTLLSGRTTRTDILRFTPLVRERIRAIEGKLQYDVEKNNAKHSITVGLTHGLSMLSSSQAGDPNLSRPEAEPDFALLELAYNLRKPLGNGYSAFFDFHAQGANKPLFSSYEFGYGGTVTGRAYEASQFTGDHGLSAKAEVRYYGMQPIADEYRLLPSLFYDAGKVWNIDASTTDEWASSVGASFYLLNQSGLTTNLGIAWPVSTKAAPSKIQTLDNVRLLFNLDYAF